MKYSQLKKDFENINKIAPPQELKPTIFLPLSCRTFNIPKNIFNSINEKLKETKYKLVTIEESFQLTQKIPLMKETHYNLRRRHCYPFKDKNNLNNANSEDESLNISTNKHNSNKDTFSKSSESNSIHEIEIDEHKSSDVDKKQKKKTLKKTKVNNNSINENNKDSFATFAQLKKVVLGFFQRLDKKQDKKDTKFKKQKMTLEEKKNFYEIMKVELPSLSAKQIKILKEKYCRQGSEFEFNFADLDMSQIKKFESEVKIFIEMNKIDPKHKSFAEEKKEQNLTLNIVNVTDPFANDNVIRKECNSDSSSDENSSLNEDDEQEIHQQQLVMERLNENQIDDEDNNNIVNNDLIEREIED